MWKYCVILVVLSAWEACDAQKLVNLVEPHLSMDWPRGAGFAGGQWKLFDHNKSTIKKVWTSYGDKVVLDIERPYSIRPTKYRITMAANVLRANYPSSWEVKGNDNRRNQDGPNETLDQVTGAVFKNRVYEGTLRKQIDMTHLRIEFQQSATLAEVELLGPRSALNSLWPYGKYPCSQRLAVITSRRAPKKLFTGSKGSISNSEFRDNPEDGSEYYRIWKRLHFDGAKPFIIGAKLPKVPVVREVVLRDVFIRFSVRKVVLQGSFCQPHCRMGWSKGWVSLGAHKPKYGQPRIHVKNPGKYKAYRLKFFPSRSNGRLKKHFWLYDFAFLGCTA